MGSCFGAPSPSLTPALLASDQPHLMISTGKGGSDYLITYYYSDLQPHLGTLTLTVHNNGRTVTGSGRDDIDHFTIDGRFVVLSPINVQLYFTKRYSHYNTSSIEYSGQCANGGSSVYVGEWTIGWLGRGSWDMRPVGGERSTSAITLTDSVRL